MELEEIHTVIDRLESEINEHEPANCPVYHIFTPMLYTRQIFMPEGTLIVSKIHKYQPPFIISQGIAHVKVNDGEWQKLEAPYTGITEPGTRRVLYIEKDCIWSTFHVSSIVPEDDTEEGLQRAVKKIEDVIIMKRNELNFNEPKEIENHA
jgi:hypothetical protein